MSQHEKLFRARQARAQMHRACLEPKRHIHAHEAPLVKRHAHGGEDFRTITEETRKQKLGMKRSKKNAESTTEARRMNPSEKKAAETDPIEKLHFTHLLRKPRPPGAWWRLLRLRA